MLEAPRYAATGTRYSEGFALPADYFDGTVNEPVLHQAVKSYLANQRQGTHATKTRRYVTGGNQKPWRQKGTGRARQGSTRAPHWPGGGTVFGPHPREYREELPKKVKALARRSALNARAREGRLWVIDGMALEAPKTARVAGMLDAMGLAGQQVLVLTDGVNRNVYLSCRNLPTVEVLPYAEASAYHVIRADAVLVEGGAVGATTPAEAEPAEGQEPARRPTARGRKAGGRTASGARPKTTSKATGAKTAKSARSGRKPTGKKKGAE